jgi:hypothetical protein
VGTAFHGGGSVDVSSEARDGGGTAATGFTAMPDAFPAIERFSDRQLRQPFREGMSFTLDLVKTIEDVKFWKEFLEDQTKSVADYGREIFNEYLTTIDPSSLPEKEKNILAKARENPTNKESFSHAIKYVSDKVPSFDDPLSDRLRIYYGSLRGDEPLCRFKEQLAAWHKAISGDECKPDNIFSVVSLRGAAGTPLIP